MSVRLYVKLPKAQLEKEGVEKMFNDFEDSFTTKLIRERKRRECRGFGFVTVSTDEAAEAFISKYNEKPFVYEGETFKDEEGKDFILLIEKALPRTKNEQEEENDNDNETNTEESKPSQSTTPLPELKSSKPTPRPKKASGGSSSNTNKNRKGTKSKASKAVPVAESIQPDPRWATALNELKERFSAQTNN